MTVKSVTIISVITVVVVRNSRPYLYVVDISLLLSVVGFFYHTGISFMNRVSMFPRAAMASTRTS